MYRLNMIKFKTFLPNSDMVAYLSLGTVVFCVEHCLSLLLSVSAQDLVDTILGFLSTLRQPQIHCNNRLVLVHSLL